MDFYKNKGKFLSLDKTINCPPDSIKDIKNLIRNNIIQKVQIAVLILNTPNAIRIIPEDERHEILSNIKWVYDEKDSIMRLYDDIKDRSRTRNSKPYTVYIRKCSNTDVDKLFWIIMDLQRLSVGSKKEIDIEKSTNWFIDETEYMRECNQLRTNDNLAIFIAEKDKVDKYIKDQIHRPMCSLIATFIQQAIDKPNMNWMYAVSESKVVGFMTFCGYKDTGLYVDILCRDLKFVYPERIGAKMIKLLQIYGENRGKDHTILNATIQAQNGYRHMGFIDIGTTIFEDETLYRMISIYPTILEPPE